MTPSLNKEREAFEAHLGRMPTWAPEFEIHRGWVEAFAWDVWQGRAALASTPSALPVALTGEQVCAEFDALSQRVQWNSLSAVNAAWHAFKSAIKFAEKHLAIVGTPSKEGAAQVEAAQLLFDFGGFLTSSERQWVFSSRDDAAPMVDAIRAFAARQGINLDATPPASPSEGGGEPTDAQIMRAIINACDSLNITRVHELGGKTRTIAEEAGLLEIGRAVLSLSPSRGELVAHVDQRNGTKVHWVDGNAATNLPHGTELYAGAAIPSRGSE